MVPVTLVGHGGQQSETFALLDSGADYCLFHAIWARSIGLNLKAGRPDYLYNIDPESKLLAYFHRIDLRIGTIKVRCDVGFSDNVGQDPTDQLIGRAVVFNRIRFALRQKVLSLYAAAEF
jgi:hypothetical protein